MTPAWTFLGTANTGEFSYSGRYRIKIRGHIEKGEWVLDIRVNVMPYFAWGSNSFKSGMRCPFNYVVRYFLMEIFNEVSEYTAEGRDEIFSIIRHGLE